MVDFILSAVVWIGLIGNFILGGLVFTRNPRSRTNQGVGLLALFATIWCISLYYHAHPIFLSSDMWLRITYADVLFLVGSIFFVSLVFPKENKKWPWLIILCTVTGLPFIYLIFGTKLFLTGVNLTLPYPSQVLGPLYYLFGIWSALFSLLGVYIFYRSYRKSAGLQKLQLRYVFLGMCSFTVMPVLFDIVFPIFFNFSDFIWFSCSSSCFLVAGLSYAILKHRFLDIRLVLARSVAYFTLISILAVMYAAGMLIVGTLVTHTASSPLSLITSTTLALIMAITFQPLRRYLEKVTSKYFYKDAYDTDELLYMLSQVMSSSLTLKVLTENVMEMLRAKIHITKMEIFVVDQKGQNVLQVVPADQSPYPLTPEDIKLLEKTDAPLIFDELPEGEEKNIMRQRDIAIFLKLKTTHRLVGYLILGNKTSGEIYFDQDIRTLSIMAPEFAVAIENSLSYEEIREFNETLQQEIKKATEELSLANDQLKEVDRLKDEFISIASHDLRTPLTTVKNFLWLTLNKSKLDAKTKDNLTRAYNAADRTAMLVADMLDVSRIEGNRIEMKIASIALDEVLGEVIDDEKPKAEAKKVKLIVSGDKNTTVMADHERLLQIISNLVDNAIKFTPEEGSVTVSVKDTKDKIVMDVSDTGIGIDQKDFPKLFTKFGRLHNTLSSIPEAPGTGLGLYIAKKMMGLLSGTIEVTSKVGKGTTFTCIFNKV